MSTLGGSMRATVLLALLAVVPARAGGASVYRIDLPWDIAVSTVAAAAIIVPYAQTDSIIHPRCPCPESEVPGFDLSDLGASEPFLEDTVVFAETLLVNGALVTTAKYSAQRPIPRVYSGVASAPSDYRSF